MKLIDYLMFLAIVLIAGLLHRAFHGSISDLDWAKILIIAAMATTINAVRSERSA